MSTYFTARELIHRIPIECQFELIASNLRDGYIVKCNNYHRDHVYDLDKIIKLMYKHYGLQISIQVSDGYIIIKMVNSNRQAAKFLSKD